MKRGSRVVIGWREWVALPDLGIGRIKAKVDTGARTSSLHAYDVELFRRKGVRMARFKVHPLQRDSREVIAAEARVVEKRLVRTSSGIEKPRPIIVTPVRVGEEQFAIELTLARRDAMGFRMLLGRQAIRGKFIVDPGRSFIVSNAARKTPPVVGEEE